MAAGCLVGTQASHSPVQSMVIFPFSVSSSLTLHTVKNSRGQCMIWICFSAETPFLWDCLCKFLWFPSPQLKKTSILLLLRTNSASHDPASERLLKVHPVQLLRSPSSQPCPALLPTVQGSTTCLQPDNTDDCKFHFVSLLWGHCSELPVVQCLKSIFCFSFLSSRFLVV